MLSNNFKIGLLQDVKDEREQPFNVQTCKLRSLLSAELQTNLTNKISNNSVQSVRDTQ